MKLIIPNLIDPSENSRIDKGKLNSLKTAGIILI